MNVGTLDALIRTVVGWVLIHLAIITKISLSRPLKVILLIIGLVLIITAVTRYCGLYTLFKISTFKS
jgi:hypothetical protein